MADIKWIKITTNMFDDEKIKLIEAMPDADSILVIWIKMLTLAGRCNDNGSVTLSEDMPYSDEMLSTVFHRPLNTIRLALSIFEKYKMITISQKEIEILNWSKHQNIEGMEKIREQTRIRVAKHRQNKQLEYKGSNATVTVRNALDKNRDKNRIDKDSKPSQAQLPDDEFIKKLKESPAYKGIDINRELAKMDTWLFLPANRNRKKTMRFIVNWLNKCDPAVNTKPGDDYESYIVRK